jgi:hypothetical protein
VVTYVKKRSGPLEKTVTARGVAEPLPKGGNPANVNQDDRDLMKMAEGPGPFVTSSIISSRLNFSGPTATKTVEDSNADFDPAFFKTE